MTYYVLFFIEVGSRRVSLGGITRQPDSSWMAQVARNATMQDNGYLNGCRYVLHDRDQKFCHEFRETLAAQRCGVHANPGKKSQPQRPRGALGSFHQRGMSIEADLVWGDLATACRVRVSATLPWREKPPRQGQSFAIPGICSE